MQLTKAVMFLTAHQEQSCVVRLGGQSTNAACSLVLSSSFGVLAAWCSWCHEQSRSFMGAASECCPGQLPNTLRSCTLAHYLLEAVVQKIQLNLLAHYKCCAEIISKLYAVCISHPYQDIFSCANIFVDCMQQNMNFCCLFNDLMHLHSFLPFNFHWYSL